MPKKTPHPTASAAKRANAPGAADGRRESSFKPAFEHCAGDYAQHRPTYPDGVLEMVSTLARSLGDKQRPAVVDVGAGTGIFSRLLARQGLGVFSVEPSLAMLRLLVDSPAAGPAEHCPVPLCATAEALPLASQSADAVAAAQAFHWFNPPKALAEFARVLRPRGWLVLLWNNRNASHSPFVEAFEQLVARHNPNYEREFRQQDWSGKIAACRFFEPSQYHRFDHDWVLAADDFVGFTRSASYIRNVLSAGQRRQFESDLRALIAVYFAERRAVVPLRAEVWTARRTSGGFAG